MKWTWREIFDKEFLNKFKEKFGGTLIRWVRIVVMLMLISVFFHFSIVPSESMYPTMEVGDYILLYTLGDDYERGDIIAFKFPENEEETYLKRIIGLPGERVEVSDGKVWVNGNVIEEDYIHEAPSYQYEEVTVPSGEYFVLGDNRNNSYDSSYFGFVREEKIKGKVMARLLPISRFEVAP